jgi:hypothetical protein
MGKAFAKVVKDYVNEAGVPATQLGIFAGLTTTAPTNWKRGTALPAYSNLMRLTMRVESPEWKQRFLDAWKQDSTPPEVWRELVALRDGDRSSLPGQIPALETEDQRGALRVLLQMIAGTPEMLDPLIATAKVIRKAKEG